MGSRLRGTILPGAMPWHHRWIGNPILTGFLNLLFRTGVSDAHCGLRMVSADALPRLRLRTPGMEFASEMVIAARRAGVPMAETPIVYSPRPSGSESKLRSLHDGLRHVRYMLAWSSGELRAGSVAAIAVLGLVLLLLPHASAREVSSGVGLLIVAALALQATVSLSLWRRIATLGIRGSRLERVLDRRVLLAVGSATLIAAFVGATALARVAGSHGTHTSVHRVAPRTDGDGRL
jgi:hypothetical protein